MSRADGGKISIEVRNRAPKIEISSQNKAPSMMSLETHKIVASKLNF